jgi:hypothetical protein
MKPKADWGIIDSPPQKNEPIYLFYCEKQKSKKKMFVHFLGESTARQSAYSFI